jgi:hypothetical protein
MGRKEAEAKKLRREISNTVDVYFEGSYTKAELTKLSQHLNDGINDTEWTGLRARFNLPDKSREFIDDLTATYWDWRIDHTIPPGLRDKVDRVQAQAQLLAKTLRNLRTDRNFFKGIYAYYNLSPSEQAKFLDKTVGQLHQLDQLLAEAITRITNPAHHPSHRAVWQTLRILSNYLTTIGQALDDSPKSIAYPIILRADPRVTKEALRAILKEFVAARPKWDDSSLYVDEKFR